MNYQRNENVNPRNRQAPVSNAGCQATFHEIAPDVQPNSVGQVLLVAPTLDAERLAQSLAAGKVNPLVSIPPRHDCSCYIAHSRTSLAPPHFRTSIDVDLARTVVTLCTFSHFVASLPLYPLSLPAYP